MNLGRLTLQELRFLHSNVEEEIEKRARIQLIQEIKTEVNEQEFGFHANFDENIDGLLQVQLPLNIDVYAYMYGNAVDEKAIYVSGLSKVQAPWVKWFDFEYEPVDADIVETPQGWYYGNVRCYSIITKKVTFYYKAKPIPINGEFIHITEDGNVIKYKVKGDKLLGLEFINGSFARGNESSCLDFSIAEWKQQHRNPFIIEVKEEIVDEAKTTNKGS